MEIRKLGVEELKPAAYNPRKALKKGDKEYKKIERSIEEFGYIDPIIVNSDLTIIGGHQRFTVLKDLGFKEVECVMVDVDKDKEKALNIALNKISGEWDLPKLKDVLLELDSGVFDVELTGFDMVEIEELMTQYHVEESGEVKEDEFDVDQNLENIKTPKTKRGDIWILGRHRLMCGDSTSSKEVETLMDGKKADMLLTDPPYNVAYEGKTKEALTIQNDKMNNDNFRAFLRDAFSAANNVLKPGGVFYIWHADMEGFNFRAACVDVGWKVRQCLIWNKNTMVFGRQDYHVKHEPCLYGWKEGAAHLWAADRKQVTVMDFDRFARNGVHPTMKPVGLFDYQVKNNTKGEDIVLDLFLGSGTAIIACEQNGRIAYGLELDEKYCDVIVNRYIELVGSSEGVFLYRDGENIPYEYV